MLCPRPPADSINFVQCSMKIIGKEATQLMNFNVFIVVHFKKMGGQLLATAPLTSFEDHGGHPKPRPSAVIR